PRYLRRREDAAAPGVPRERRRCADRLRLGRGERGDHSRPAPRGGLRGRPRRCERAEPRVHPRLAAGLGRRELRRLGHHRSREAGPREVLLRPVLLRAGGLGMIDPAARGAWRELEAKLRPFIARRLRSEVDVDDIVQEVFLRMQRGLAGLRDEQRFGPWVYQIARSAIVDHQRVAAKHRVVDADRSDEQRLDVGEDDRAVEAELAGYLAPFVAMLPSSYREALT